MNKFYAVILCTLLSVLLTSCDQTKTEPVVIEEEKFTITDLEADEALKLIQSGEVIALDVRTPGEWDSGHIEGAVHCNIADAANFEANMAELDYSKPYVVY